MPFDRGAISFTRFLVEGPVPDFFADEFLDSLYAMRFQARDDMEEGEDNIGWTTVDNLFDTEFDVDKVTVNQFVRLAIRVDRKTLAPTVVRAHCRIEEQEARENSPRRLSTAQRREILDRVRERLLAETPARTSTAEIAWDTSRHEVYVATTSDKLAANVADLMQMTFGVSLQPAMPCLLAFRMNLEPEHIEALETEIESCSFATYVNPHAAAQLRLVEDAAAEQQDTPRTRDIPFTGAHGDHNKRTA